MLMQVEFQETNQSFELEFNENNSNFNPTFTDVQPITIKPLVVDDSLSTTSLNPVQNKVITERINEIEKNIGDVEYLLSTI